MATRTIKNTLTCNVIFGSALLIFVVVLTGTGASVGSNNQSDSQLSVLFHRLVALENMNQKLEKSQVGLKERFKSLKKQVEEMRNDNFVGEDVWLLTPPLRGRRGQKGEKGESGPKGDSDTQTVRVLNSTTLQEVQPKRKQLEQNQKSMVTQRPTTTTSTTTRPRTTTTTARPRITERASVGGLLGLMRKYGYE